MLIVFAFAEEEVHQDFKYVWLQQRDDEQASLRLESPQHLVEVAAAHLDRRLLIVHRDGIERALVDGDVVHAVRELCRIQLRAIADLVVQLLDELRRPIFLHLGDYLLLVVDAVHEDLLAREPHLRRQLLRQVRIAATWHHHHDRSLCRRLEPRLHVSLQVAEVSVPLKSVLESVTLEELFPVLLLLQLLLLFRQEFDCLLSRFFAFHSIFVAFD